MTANHIPSLAKRFFRDQRGAAAAEFVMVMPLLAMILIGIIEFGRLFQDFHTVSKGVRDASRFLTRMPANACAGGAWTLQTAADATEAQNMAVTGELAGGTATPAYFTTGMVTVTLPCVANAPGFAGLYDGEANIRLVQVQAVVPYNFLFGEYLIPGTAALNMTSTHLEAHLGE